MAQQIVDLFVIGGGINGAGIARDAVGRGYSVYLCEQGDIGGATSSSSTKLLHGGLRYLEHYEFRLVREALIEREILWGIAPHIVRPLRFVLPHSKGMRPAWLLQLGLFIYDNLGGRRLLPATSKVHFERSELGQGLRDDLVMGFEYSDCWVEDNRLVVLNALDAVERGAVVKNGARCVEVKALSTGGWQIRTLDLHSKQEELVYARMLINAAGPWADSVVRDIVKRPPKGCVRQVQGSHIVVPKLYDHDRCFIFQNGDGRIVFTIPFEEEFTLVGTTDRDYTGDPSDVKISAEETAYLCDLASHYFKEAINVEDVVWTYSGVRPLYDDGSFVAQNATRDYVLELDEQGESQVLSVFGGKITTYRRLAESVLEKVKQSIGEPEKAGLSAGWTGAAALPGGDFSAGAFAEQVQKFHDEHTFLTIDQSTRLVRQYGTRAWRVLAGARNREGLGRDFGAGLYEVEVLYLQRHEWARSAEDVVFRRSKIGLRMQPHEISSLDIFMKSTFLDSTAIEASLL